MNLIHARALPAGVVAVGFAILARAIGSVTDGGAIAGVLVAFILMLAGGFSGFIPLLTLFALTVISTAGDISESNGWELRSTRRGRKASQVLANLGCGCSCALPAIWFPKLARFAVHRGCCRTGGGRRRYRLQRDGPGDGAQRLHDHATFAMCRSARTAPSALKAQSVDVWLPASWPGSAPWSDLWIGTGRR